MIVSECNKNKDQSLVLPDCVEERHPEKDARKNQKRSVRNGHVCTQDAEPSVDYQRPALSPPILERIL